MEEQKQKSMKPHKVMLDRRAMAMISGVTEVVSFDENEIVLETSQGTLTVKGDDLKVNRLTVEQGEVDIGGRVDSFSYAQIRERRGQGESFFSRLFG